MSMCAHVGAFGKVYKGEVFTVQEGSDKVMTETVAIKTIKREL